MCGGQAGFDTNYDIKKEAAVSWFYVFCFDTECLCVCVCVCVLEVFWG